MVLENLICLSIWKHSPWKSILSFSSCNLWISFLLNTSRCRMHQDHGHSGHVGQEGIFQSDICSPQETLTSSSIGQVGNTPHNYHYSRPGLCNLGDLYWLAMNLRCLIYQNAVKPICSVWDYLFPKNYWPWHLCVVSDLLHVGLWDTFCHFLFQFTCHQDSEKFVL